LPRNDRSSASRWGGKPGLSFELGTASLFGIDGSTPSAAESTPLPTTYPILPVDEIVLSSSSSDGAYGFKSDTWTFACALFPCIRTTRGLEITHTTLCVSSYVSLSRAVNYWLPGTTDKPMFVPNCSLTASSLFGTRCTAELDLRTLPATQSCASSYALTAEHGRFHENLEFDRPPRIPATPLRVLAVRARTSEISTSMLVYLCTAERALGQRLFPPVVLAVAFIIVSNLLGPLTGFT